MTSAISKIFDWVSQQKKRVYFFHEGSIEDKNLLGSKGANICEMFRLGLPVPPGFVISAETCSEFFKQEKHKLLEHFVSEYSKSVREIEKLTGKQFGASTEKSRGGSFDTPPLLFSIRSGAAEPIPGMMQTIINVGINDDLVQVMARISNNPRWAYDTYRRFITMFGIVVLHIDSKLYYDIEHQACTKRGVASAGMLNAADLQQLVGDLKAVAEIPMDPWEQLQVAIEAMFCSWYSPRAVKYRDIHNMAADMGTAVVVQSMVYGNMNTRSGCGILFTRHPVTGEKTEYGHYMSNTEGDSETLASSAAGKVLDTLKHEQPVVYDALLHMASVLEKHYRDMQEIEFTVENGVLFLLESRNGKRTAKAALTIAVAMVTEKLLNEREALLRIDPLQMDYFLHPMIDPAYAGSDNSAVRDVIMGQGIGAAGGLITGKATFSLREVEECRRRGEACIFCKQDITAVDLSAVKLAAGVLTTQGGNSFSTDIQKECGKASVVEVKQLRIDGTAQTVVREDNHELTVKSGDVITIDGSTGLVYRGEVPAVGAAQDEYFYTVLNWADKYKKLRVFASCEDLQDVRKAFELGATGVGLLRTERMFQDKSCLDLFRRVLLSDSESERCRHLSEILPLQEAQFAEVFRSMNDRPVTVRLLDCPLQQFFPSPKSPSYHDEVHEMAGRLGLSADDCMSRIKALQEVNPMLGKRGCRLSILHPEITIMQTKAVIGAALRVKQEGVSVKPHIVIPMVCSDHELDCVTPVIYKTWAAVCEEAGHSVNFLECTIGSMVEVPRACLRTEKIAVADYIDFLCIGTAGLTQLIFGVSREDMQKFLPMYLEKHIIAKDPFLDLDVPAVGSMVQLAVRKSRTANPGAKISVCGEHAGDPNSIRFFNKIAVDALSCSPYRVPIAKVAAAQAHIEETGNVSKTYYHPFHV